MAEIYSLRDADTRAIAEKCAFALSRGRVAIIPTDTVYGMAASVEIHEAVRRIYAIKGRDASKALVVMVATPEEAAEIAVPHEREDLMRLAAFWPGPLTLVVEARDVRWREWVAPASRTLGIRIPAHPFMLELLSLTGALAVTSANVSGEEAPAAADELDPRILARVDLVVEGSRVGSGRPSTVAELREGEVRVLRQGDVREEELVAALARRGGGVDDDR